MFIKIQQQIQVDYRNLIPSEETNGNWMMIKEVIMSLAQKTLG